MDALTFIVELLKAAAWPIAALVIAVLFHKQFAELLGRMTKGKIGVAEFEFERKVDELREESGDQDTLPLIEFELPQFASLTREDPRAAVLNAWIQVESEIDRLARSATGPDGGRLRSTTSRFKTIQDAQLLSADHARRFKELRSLRNIAAHHADFNPSASSVASYVKNAKEFAAILSGLG